MSEPRRAGLAAAFATAALAILVAVGVASTERLLAGYVLVLAAIALAALTRLAQRPEDVSRFDAVLVPRRARELRPPELVRTERELVLGESSAGYAHRHLLPLLREAAAARLASAHDVDLERRPERARELLGDDAWELLRPDRPAPPDRHSPGVAAAAIERVVSALEQL